MNGTKLKASLKSSFTQKAKWKYCFPYPYNGIEARVSQMPDWVSWILAGHMSWTKLKFRHFRNTWWPPLSWAILGICSSSRQSSRHRIPSDFLKKILFSSFIILFYWSFLKLHFIAIFWNSDLLGHWFKPSTCQTESYKCEEDKNLLRYWEYAFWSFFTPLLYGRHLTSGQF